MDREFSVEECLFSGTSVFKRNNTVAINTSVDTTDNVIKDLTQAREDLRFFDTYAAINEKNTGDKMKMLKRINNVYAKNILDVKARNSIESYIAYNIQSTEDEASETAANNGTNVPKKKNFFKKIIEFLKNFVMKIVNFIKTIFNKVLTFFKTLTMNPQKLQLVKENPYKGDDKKNYLNYSSFNLSGIEKFCKIYRNLKAQINSNSTGDSRNVSQNASGLNKAFGTFMSKMQSKLKFDPTFESVAWNLFGMKACNGDECYKYASVKTLTYLTGIGGKESPIKKNLEEINSVLAEINKVFEPLQKFAEDMDAGKGAKQMNTAARTAAARMNETQNANGKVVNNTGFGDGFKGSVEAVTKGSVKIIADGENFEITSEADFKDALNFFKGLIKTTNISTEIISKFAKDAKALIDLNSGKPPKENKEQPEQKK